MSEPGLEIGQPDTETPAKIEHATRVAFVAFMATARAQGLKVADVRELDAIADPTVAIRFRAACRGVLDALR